MKDENGTTYIEICGTVVARTPDAVLLNDGSREEWVPESQIEDEQTDRGITTLLMPEWLAVKKGFV
jgi:hypothetical protein